MFELVAKKLFSSRFDSEIFHGNLYFLCVSLFLAMTYFLFLITQRVAPGFSSPPSILYLVWGKWKIQNLVQDPKILCVFSSQFQSRVPLSFLTRPRSHKTRTNRTTFEYEYTYGHVYVCMSVRALVHGVRDCTVTSTCLVPRV